MTLSNITRQGSFEANAGDRTRAFAAQQTGKSDFTMKTRGERKKRVREIESDNRIPSMSLVGQHRARDREKRTSQRLQRKREKDNKEGGCAAGWKTANTSSLLGRVSQRASKLATDVGSYDECKMHHLSKLRARRSGGDRGEERKDHLILLRGRKCKKGSMP